MLYYYVNNRYISLQFSVMLPTFFFLEITISVSSNLQYQLLEIKILTFQQKGIETLHLCNSWRCNSTTIHPFPGSWNARIAFILRDNFIRQVGKCIYRICCKTKVWLEICSVNTTYVIFYFIKMIC
jgi:hypothetical protein